MNFKGTIGNNHLFLVQSGRRIFYAISSVKLIQVIHMAMKGTEFIICLLIYYKKRFRIYFFFNLVKSKFKMKYQTRQSGVINRGHLLQHMA